MSSQILFANLITPRAKPVNNIPLFAQLDRKNVDGFITKIEDIAQTSWGIEKSRTAKTSNQNEN
jgi:hypothetical protein